MNKVRIQGKKCQVFGNQNNNIKEIENSNSICVSDQCRKANKIDYSGDENQVMKNMVEEIEKKRLRVYIKLKSMRQLPQLKKLLPELESIPQSKIKTTLLNNQLKWPIENFRVAINAIRPFAELLGLEIVAE